ncbi:hypothetical protein GLOIN_2v1873345 [Rhizophagus clarus]|uniref:Uncharacterized protein n=1 Tax=Rhizophagus clarus TaxID=94130 RepID=A0A8H3QQ16_9GLOM|nr:hypothetical protein GLOIN_2v1873345 [Rhizophagus clarus]
MFSDVKTILGKRRLRRENVQKENKNVYIFCTATPKQEPLEGKFLLKPARELSSKPPKDWDDNDLMPIVKLLAGRPYIDGRGDQF